MSSTTLVVLISVLPNFTHKSLRLPAEDAVFIFAPAAVGVALGNWLVPRLTRAGGKSRLSSLGFALFLVCLIGLGLSSPMVSFFHQHGMLGPLGALAPGFFYSRGLFASLLSAPLGLGYALVLAAARLITYEHVPHDMQGRIFAFQGVLSSLASIAPLILVGLVTALVGPRLVLLVVVALNLVVFTYARQLRQRPLGPRSGLLAMPRWRSGW